MALQCNIDARGKALRLIYGIVLLITGTLSGALWAYPRGTTFPWVIVACVIFSGAFSVFEGRKGWCAIRALGFKTPV